MEIPTSPVSNLWPTLVMTWTVCQVRTQPQCTGTKVYSSVINTGCTTADIERLMGTDEEALRRKSALFLLKMKEKNLLTQAAIDDMVEETTTLFEHTFTMLKAGVREELATCGVQVDLDRVFNNLTDPFEGLKTHHFQEKCFKDTLKLIVSFCC